MHTEQHLRELEEKLLQPAIRRNAELAAPLLAEEFREFGSSGRIFDKQQIIAAMRNETSGELSMRDARVELSLHAGRWSPIESPASNSHLRNQLLP